MSDPDDPRNARFPENDEPRRDDEYRTDAQRDRDRILHASAFGRLAGVTQVIPPSDEGHLLHNRMTHSVKVAQVARRVAELLLRDQPRECEQVGGIDPDVVEAAALAHDLGHPPFGHITENALKEVIAEKFPKQLGDGFEGNAQTFRIVTRLARRAPHYEGLNLTRATLNAILKYPWLRGAGAGRRQEKWNVYEAEKEIFEWARELPILTNGDVRKTPEAELMDWADDIAYSVHDIEDFYRVGAIPLHRLSRADGKSDDPELNAFYNGAAQRRQRAEIAKDSKHTNREMEQAFEEIRGMFPVTRYAGGGDERGRLRAMSKEMIGRFVRAIKIRVPTGPKEDFVEIDPKESATVAMLKELTWHYVINNPALATQQHGQTRMIRTLFEIFSAAVLDPDQFKILPAATRESLEKLLVKLAEGKLSKSEVRVLSLRTAVDVMAGMTEQQTLRVYRRLMGFAPGSALDRIY